LKISFIYNKEYRGGTMSCYFLAQINIHNEAEYAQYLAGADEIFSKFNGRYLAVDDCPKVLEGRWDHSRVVLIEFPDEAELKRWYDSPEYQELLKHRLAAAACDTVLVKGIG
jgi:uncharacterized protein (DUF1330 family)